MPCLKKSIADWAEAVETARNIAKKRRENRNFFGAKNNITNLCARIKSGNRLKQGRINQYAEFNIKKSLPW
jgi:hypothetical protein